MSQSDDHPIVHADDAQQTYRIEMVAARTGLTKRTLRYYEEIGLLDPPVRTEGNYRLYTAEDIRRLEQIVQLKASMGLSLDEIRTWLTIDEERDEIRQAFQQSANPAERLTHLYRAEELAQEQLALVEAKITGLNTLRDAILQRRDRLARLRVEAQERLHDEAGG